MLFSPSLRTTIKLSREEEKQLVESWVRDDDEKSVLKLLMAESKNIAFLAKGAHKKNQTIPEDDLQQVAVEAFIKCLSKFDPEQGNRIATFSGWWMKSALSAYAYQDNTIKRSSLSTNWSIKIATRQELAKHHEYDVPLAEVFVAVATKLNVPRETVEYYYIQSLALKSLDAPISSQEDNDATLLDKAGQSTQADQEDHCNQEALIALVRESLNELPAREQYVLRKRFGIATQEDEAMLKDIGEDMGVSRERARQLEARGITMMAASLAEKGFSPENIREILSP